MKTALMETKQRLDNLPLVNSFEETGDVDSLLHKKNKIRQGKISASYILQLRLKNNDAYTEDTIVG